MGKMKLVMVALLLLMMVGNAYWWDNVDPHILEHFTKTCVIEYEPELVGTPNWYYQKNNETTHDVIPLLKLAGEVNYDDGRDCSIRGAFMEWAAEYNGHHAMLCLKKTGDNNEGGWDTHTYIKLDYPYQPIKGKHLHSYCYYDTLDGETLILDSNPEWSWFDNPTLIAETLDEFIDGIQNELGQDMDYEYEFYWWEREDMMECMRKVKEYQHRNKIQKGQGDV